MKILETFIAVEAWSYGFFVVIALKVAENA